MPFFVTVSVPYKRRELHYRGRTYRLRSHVVLYHAGSNDYGVYPLEVE